MEDDSVSRIVAICPEMIAGEHLRSDVQLHQRSHEGVVDTEDADIVSITRIVCSRTIRHLGELLERHLGDLAQADYVFDRQSITDRFRISGHIEVRYRVPTNFLDQKDRRLAIRQGLVIIFHTVDPLIPNQSNMHIVLLRKGENLHSLNSDEVNKPSFYLARRRGNDSEFQWEVLGTCEQIVSEAARYRRTADRTFLIQDYLESLGYDRDSVMRMVLNFKA
ncbi:MAG: hypothetical protein PHS44_06945 [Candidatus Dojkabacteria bacterium]|nr:hypothetical protein [Candidatus Dojkabacteria bacterium]